MKQLYILILGVLLSCGDKERATLVQTEKIELRNITEKVEGLGKVQPELEVNISSDVAGRIVYLPGLPGDKVKKGQILAKIEEKTYLADLERKRSSQKSQQASYNKAQNLYKRAEELHSKNLMSIVDYENAKADLQMASASLEQANTSVKEAIENLEKCTVRSPIDGVITVKNKEEGEIAQGSSFNLDVIMIVANLNVMETVVDIVENDIVKIKLGQKVELEIDAFPNRIFNGIVKEIANSAKTSSASSDPVTNFEVTILIEDKEAALRPGMNVTSNIVTNMKENTISVPIQAVTARMDQLPKLAKSEEEKNIDDAAKADQSDLEQLRNDKDKNKLVEVVFVLNSDKTVSQRKITKGISNDDYYEVLDGLVEGDQVVVGPFRTLSQNLKDGDKIRTKSDDKKTAKKED